MYTNTNDSLVYSPMTDYTQTSGELQLYSQPYTQGQTPISGDFGTFNMSNELTLSARHLRFDDEGEAVASGNKRARHNASSAQEHHVPFTEDDYGDFDLGFTFTPTPPVQLSQSQLHDLRSPPRTTPQQKEQMDTADEEYDGLGQNDSITDVEAYINRICARMEWGTPLNKQFNQPTREDIRTVTGHAMDPASNSIPDISTIPVSLSEKILQSAIAVDSYGETPVHEFVKVLEVVNEANREKLYQECRELCRALNDVPHFAVQVLKGFAPRQKNMTELVAYKRKLETRLEDKQRRARTKLAETAARKQLDDLYKRLRATEQRAQHYPYKQTRVDIMFCSTSINRLYIDSDSTTQRDVAVRFLQNVAILWMTKGRTDNAFYAYQAAIRISRQRLIAGRHYVTDEFLRIAQGALNVTDNVTLAETYGEEFMGVHEQLKQAILNVKADDIEIDPSKNARATRQILFYKMPKSKYGAIPKY